MNREQLRKEKAIRKELLRVEKEEGKLAQAAQKAKPAGWKQELENRIPEKVYSGLESAFAKGFSLVFQQGRGIIEKTYRRSDLEAEYAIRDFAVQRKGGKKELHRLQAGARQGSLRNLAMTTVEGLGLGALGIGMPDIVLFLGTLLKGVYETALAYGFAYDTPQEQMWVLKMLSTSLSSGDAWAERNAQVEEMLTLETVDITQVDLNQQIRQTASVFFRGYAASEIYPGFAGNRYSGRRCQSGVLPQGHEICAAEIPEAVPAAVAESIKASFQGGILDGIF